MRKITRDQIKIIHTLLSNSGKMPFKRQLIYEFSDHRTDSSKELSVLEGKALIQYLKEVDPCQNMRRKIISLFYQLGWIEDKDGIDRKINIGAINNWLQFKGVVKKPLKRLSKSELIKVTSQLNLIKKKTLAIQSKKEKALAESQVDAMLAELNIKQLMDKQ